MSKKLALIIGSSQYKDTRLEQLITPGADVRKLKSLLRDGDIGGFDEVTTLVNQTSRKVREAIADLFAGKEPEDLLLLFFSGHGVRDDRGDLYLATKDTKTRLLSATAIPAAFVTGEMDRSRSRCQVLILDCCHSGAFARGSKGAPGASVGTAAAFEGTGYGRVVLTASDSTQYAWEGDEITGQAENSVFTHYLIQALKTGEADSDADGCITVDELYDYVYKQVVNKTPKQTPGKWAYKQEGRIVFARNPRPVVKPAELPRALVAAMESPLSGAREGVVHDLDRLLRGSHKGLAAAAQEALKRLAETDDSIRVRDAATECLKEYAEAPGETGGQVEARPKKSRRVRPDRGDKEVEAKTQAPEEMERRHRQQLSISFLVLQLRQIGGKMRQIGRKKRIALIALPVIVAIVALGVFLTSLEERKDRVILEERKDKVIEAFSSLSPLSQNVGSGGSEHGKDFIHSLEPYKPTLAVFDIEFKIDTKSKYKLWIEYAADESRPIKIRFNGELIADNALALKTGGWGQKIKDWSLRPVRVVDVLPENNRLELSRDGVFPAIKTIKFEPVP